MTGLRELTDTLVAIVSEGGAAPQRICAVCVDELPLTGAAISLVAGDERQEPVFATDHVAGELDELQFRLGEGPSVEASTRCRPVQVNDLADISDSRWPMFAVAARRTPARGM